MFSCIVLLLSGLFSLLPEQLKKIINGNKINTYRLLFFIIFKDAKFEQ
jgi:hypothetical protein